MSTLRRTLTLLAVACALLAATGATAAEPPRSADSHAPDGARLDWLPTDEWVMSSWLPYDEARLYALVQTDRTELSTWLNDRRSLGALARKRGHDSLRELADQLVAPRLAGASPRLRAALRRRALATLTQPHLANHVVFHVFHTPAIAAASKRVFGVRAATFRRLRAQGLSPAQIGARGGRPTAAVRGTLRRVFRERAARAVRIGAMSRAQADALLAHQERGLRAYVTRPFRTLTQHRAFLCRPRATE
jgi:hypothetical protein